MRGDLKLKQKNEQKMRFIFRALNDGYSVKKNNDDGTFTFTRDRSEGNEPLKSFVNKCNIKLNFSNFK